MTRSVKPFNRIQKERKNIDTMKMIKRLDSIQRKKMETRRLEKKREKEMDFSRLPNELLLLILNKTNFKTGAIFAKASKKTNYFQYRYNHRFVAIEARFEIGVKFIHLILESVKMVLHSNFGCPTCVDCEIYWLHTLAIECKKTMEQLRREKNILLANDSIYYDSKGLMRSYLLSKECEKYEEIVLQEYMKVYES